MRLSRWRIVHLGKRGRRGAGFEDRSSDAGSFCKVTSTPGLAQRFMEENYRRKALVQ